MNSTIQTGAPPLQCICVRLWVRSDFFSARRLRFTHRLSHIGEEHGGVWIVWSPTIQNDVGRNVLSIKCVRRIHVGLNPEPVVLLSTQDPVAAEMCKAPQELRSHVTAWLISIRAKGAAPTAISPARISAPRKQSEKNQGPRDSGDASVLRRWIQVAYPLGLCEM